MSIKTTFWSRSFYLAIYLCVSILICKAQDPPNNLTLDAENHMMILQGLNTSDFYNEENLESVYLEFEQSDYWQQLHDCYDTENYVLGTLTYQDQVYDSIGAQFKGNTSYSKVSNDAKYSFAISLDEYRDGQDIEGYNTFNFNNAYDDPSFMREVVFSHLNRYNIPAAKANFIKLYINGEYWGVYDNVQQLNKDFTKEWYMTNNGSLWRADAPSTSSKSSTVLAGPGGGGGGGGDNNSQWGDGTTALNYLGSDTALYQEYYTLKHSSQDNPWSLLLQLTDKLNNTPEANLVDSLWKYLDIDKALWFLAHETLFTDDDSYVMKGRQDYYLYYEPETGLFTPLEFDGNSALDSKNIDWGVFYNEDDDNYPLMNILYAVPEWRQRYLAHVRTIVDELFDETFANALVEKYDILIKEAVEADTKNMNSYADYTSSVAELKEYFTERKAIILANTEVTQVGLDIANVEHSVNGETFASPLSTEVVDITATISGNDDADVVYLYYSSYYVGRFTKVSMYDDGLHADSEANDGIYGAEIPAFETGEYVRYYIEAIADNTTNTASYSPIGAEHDVYYYRVGIPETATSSVVINEVCASNKTISTDENGEYDDWVELYNNSSESIDLTGYYLSDDMMDLTQWTLPELTIGAGEYAIIWLDKDEEQGDNHANFKLSADGEELYLLNTDGDIVDLVAFDSMESDITYGRSPNGTGDFSMMTATFNAENLASATPLDDTDELSTSIFPNPTTGNITIQTNTDRSTNLSLYNIKGQLIMQQEVIQTANIWMGDIAPGLYIVKLENTKSTVLSKLVIQ